ncbi:hypothetical protein GCM10027290_40970 [Micromonospora sonneratiae]|uniref:Uncharacterized protein n=1 Tax=Micromonospora sonneratiae TaxID=1184706 RepID=A0ABW3YQZ6_9ACTN
MPTTGHRLTRRYRRLLFSYPRDYRRERGEEIIGTLLELAPPGRTRPTVPEAANLIRHGMRARLGRPDSRAVVVWAALTATICGLFTAAIATRAAWETSRPQPGRAEATEIFDAVLPEHDLDDLTTPSALFVIYSQPLSLDNADSLLFGDGGEYGHSSTSAHAAGTPPIDPAQLMPLTQERLRAAGWHVYAPVVDEYTGCIDKYCDSLMQVTRTEVTASRGDTFVEIAFQWPPTDADAPYLSVSLYRGTPSAVPYAGVAGGLLGVLVGWLLFGWASRRTDGHHLMVRATATTLYGVTMLLWWPPTLLAVLSVWQHHLGEPHPQWHPFWEWLGQPTASLLFLVGCVAVLLALVLAALPRPGVRSAPTGKQLIHP